MLLPLLRSANLFVCTRITQKTSLIHKRDAVCHICVVFGAKKRRAAVKRRLFSDGSAELVHKKVSSRTVRQAIRVM
jgi:hypothetical protein